jgi:hypothetical protein
MIQPCPYYKQEDSCWIKCKTYDKPECCYLYQKAVEYNTCHRLNLTPNDIISVIVENLSKIEQDVIYEALSLKN